MKCELCHSPEEVYPSSHFEEHVSPPRFITICRACHTKIHERPRPYRGKYRPSIFPEVTPREREVLEAWAKHGSVHVAAEVLRLPPSTAYTRVTRLKWRYRAAKEFIREVERWMAKLPGALEK